jgi:hypothetical protein
LKTKRQPAKGREPCNLENALVLRRLSPLLCMCISRISLLRRPTTEVAHFFGHIRRFSIRGLGLLRLSRPAIFGSRLSGRADAVLVESHSKSSESAADLTNATITSLRGKRESNRDNDHCPPPHRQSNKEFALAEQKFVAWHSERAYFRTGGVFF